jgi:hypothetical protein
MSYTKCLETKIVRVKHYVDIREQNTTTAESILDSLKHVPPAACLQEIEELDTNPWIYRLIFAEERKETA